MQMSFGSLELAGRLKQENVLMKIDALIDWGKLRPNLSGLYKREQSNGGGQEPFDTLMMFKGNPAWSMAQFIRCCIGTGIVCADRFHTFLWSIVIGCGTG